MKALMRSFLILAVVTIVWTLAADPVRGQITAEVLPLNTLVTVRVPDLPLDRKTAPKKLLARCSYESQKVPDYVKVARFMVVPGQKYTLYDCHPAPADGTRISVYLDGDTPLTSYTASYGRSEGFTRSFVTRFQQPWPIVRGEQASCDLVRYNITIAPQSEHNNLYVTFVSNKPGASTRIMLKTPADSDDNVKKSAKRSWGDVKSAPFLLTNIPGESPVTVKPPVTPPGPAGGQVSGIPPVPGNVTQPPVVPPLPPQPNTPPGIVAEAPATSAGATVIPYNSTVRAYINRSDYDTFRFDFTGGRMRIASRGGLDIVADLWDAKGNRLARDGQDARKDFVIEANLPAGTYYIQIRYMYHGGEGPYTLILGSGSGPVLTEANR